MSSDYDFYQIWLKFEISIEFSSLVAPEVVKVTISGAASDANSINMTSL